MIILDRIRVYRKLVSVARLSKPLARYHARTMDAAGLRVYLSAPTSQDAFKWFIIEWQEKMPAKRRA
jgi:hypothetical protein